MTDDQRARDYESQRQYEDLRAQVARNREDIDALQSGAAHAAGRADANEDRAEVVGAKVDALEARIDVDHQMILHLQAEGLLSTKLADNLQEALRTSRTIATALGVIMACRHVTDSEAFALLSKGSQDTNRKLRLIAADIVRTGDMSLLPSSESATLQT